MELEGRRVVVAGAAGFIGSHVCDRLIAMGASVLAVDNLVTGRLENVDHLVGDDAFTFMRHDIVDDLHVDGSVDAVVNLASAASPVDYLRLPIETLETGSIGTRTLLDLAGRTGARFLLASTSEVYGDPEVHPQPEEYWGNVNPNGPRSVYDEAKRFAEALTLAHHRARGTDVRIARIFNTYGPRLKLDDGRAVPAFMAAAMEGRPLPLHGDGTQTRTLCFVDDLVDGLVALLTSDTVGPDPVNLGGSEEVTIESLARTIIDVAGSNSIIERTERPQDDPQRRQPDLGRARRELGFEPKVSMAEGLSRTFRWFSETADPASGT